MRLFTINLRHTPSGRIVADFRTLATGRTTRVMLRDLCEMRDDLSEAIAEIERCGEWKGWDPASEF